MSLSLSYHTRSSRRNFTAPYSRVREPFIHAGLTQGERGGQLFTLLEPAYRPSRRRGACTIVWLPRKFSRRGNKRGSTEREREREKRYRRHAQDGRNGDESGRKARRIIFPRSARERSPKTSARSRAVRNERRRKRGGREEEKKTTSSISRSLRVSGSFRYISSF